MTKSEFQAWKAETAKSVSNWNQDAISYLNRGDILLYKGGTSGVYVWIERDGRATIGYYQNALPHIGEAVFSEKYSKKFESQIEATAVVCDRLNLGDPTDYFLGISIERQRRTTE